MFLVIRYLVLKSAPQTDFSYYNNSLFQAPDFISQKATAIYILLRYIFLLIIPYPLSYDYTFAQIPTKHIGDVLVICGILFYFAIGVYSLITISKKNIIAFAILFFLLTLIPVSNIILLIGCTMAERFMYMPSLGYCMAITFLLIKITKTDMMQSSFKTIGQMISGNSTLFTIAFIWIGLYSIMTFARNPDWKDNITLESHDVLVSDNSIRTHLNWGSTLLVEFYPKEPDKAKQNVILDSAIKEFNTSLKIRKIHAEAYLNLGICYFNKGDVQNAIKYYEIAKSQFHKPDFNVYNNLAYCYGTIKQFDKAIANVDTALKIDNKNESAHFNKGFIFFRMGRFIDAIHENEFLLELNPNNVDAYKNISKAYWSLHDTLKAKEYFEKGNKISREQQR